MDLDDVRDGFLAQVLPTDVVDEVLEAYVEAKRRFHLGDHRPQAVEGGRFSEGVFRLLQHTSGLKVTPLAKTLPSVDRLMEHLERETTRPDSVRLHIPRTLKLIYDIRNKRDAAHLDDQIDPNLQDATLVIGNMDWVLAELVRLFHGVDADRAQEIVENLVKKEVPAVEEIDGQPVILTDLQPREQALLMLYRTGARGLSIDELASALRVDRKDHLATRLRKLDKGSLVLEHPQSGRFHLTARGAKVVEDKGLAQPLS